jgi:hypothetical protein
MSNLTAGGMYSCSDNGKPGNVLSLVPADDKGGWDDFGFLFAGANSAGQNRIYGVTKRGQLLSYAATDPLSKEVIVGSDGWASTRDGGNFATVFAGVNLLGENRIYAMTWDPPSLDPFQGNSWGNLLSYSDDGTTGNVGHPVTVGAGGWDKIGHVFAGKDSKGLGCIYAVQWDGTLLLYHDDGNPGNVGYPVVVGKGIWQNDFDFLFAGANSAGQNRIYGVNILGQLLSYSATDPVSNAVIVSEPVVINDGTPDPSGNPGWKGFVFLFAGVNSAGQNRIYGVYS